MREAASDTLRKVLALLILLIAAWVLFKIVVGVVAGLFWVVLAALAVVAIVWALRVL